jgi:hypothetical protein
MKKILLSHGVNFDLAPCVAPAESENNLFNFTFDVQFSIACTGIS